VIDPDAHPGRVERNQSQDLASEEEAQEARDQAVRDQEALEKSDVPAEHRSAQEQDTHDHEVSEQFTYRQVECPGFHGVESVVDVGGDPVQRIVVSQNAALGKIGLDARLG